MWRAIERFREYEPEASAILLQVFTTIAIAGEWELTAGQIAERLGVSQPTVSNNLTKLGIGNDKQRRRLSDDARLHLVQMRQDLTDRRRFPLALSREGNNLWRTMLRDLDVREE